MVKTSKTGIYYNLLDNGDKSFYFNYKDINDNNKLKWVNVGKYSDGIRLANAVDKRAEQLSNMKHGKDIRAVANKKKKQITIYDDLAQIYFTDKKVHKHRINKYNSYIKPLIGNKNIDNITKQMIKKILDDISSDGKAPQTVNGIRELIGAIFNHNIKEHKLKLVNPCIGIQRLKVDNNRERYLSLEEINQLKEVLKENFLIKLFVELSLQTGGRFETILHIQKKDINLSSRAVTLQNLKTGNTYTGYLQTDLISILKEYLSNLKVNDYVISFKDEHEKKLTQKQIQNRLKPILDKLFNEGLDSDDRKHRVVIHTLRHTFASHLAINGVPIFTIQKLMDHKKIEQTLRYAKLSPENGKNAIEGLYR